MITNNCEKLAFEFNNLKQDEIKQLKLRQLLRKNSPELRELESKLQAAYCNKELAAQIAEKEAIKLQKKIEDKHAIQKLLNTWVSEEDLHKKMVLEDMKRKYIYKQELQDQMILNEKRKRYEFEEFLYDKKLIDDIVERLHLEDERDIEEKRCKLLQTKAEMNAFFAARELWKQRQQEEIELENKKISDYLIKKEEEKKQRKQQQFNTDATKVAVAKKIAKEIIEKEEKRKEREQILIELNEEEHRQAEEERYRREMEKEIRQRIDTRESLMYQMFEKKERIRKEAEEDAKYKENLIVKLAEDNKLEQLSNQKKRLKMLQLRRDIEEMMKEKRRKRAEELQMAINLYEKAEQDLAERNHSIEEERMNMLKEHAKNLVGYLPKGVLKTEDLPVLQN